jgi:hypothetical protein
MARTAKAMSAPSKHALKASAAAAELAVGARESVVSIGLDLLR